MRYIKYFESKDPTIEEKVYSISGMFTYLCDNDMVDGELDNFVGRCSVLFMGCLDTVHEFRFGKTKGIPPYILDTSCLLDKIENNKLPETRLKYLDALYEFSLYPKFIKNLNDIEIILKPLFEFEVVGGNLISKHKISMCYNMDRKKPLFSVEIGLDEENFILDQKDAYKLILKTNKSKNDIEKIKHLSDDFNHYKKIIKDIIKEINLDQYGFEVSIYDNVFGTIRNNKFNLSINLIQI